jgi:hypothetical protein
MKIEELFLDIVWVLFVTVLVGGLLFVVFGWVIADFHLLTWPLWLRLSVLSLALVVALISLAIAKSED